MPQRPARRTSRSSVAERGTLQPAWCAAIIVLAGLLAYANSFYGVFVFDDVPNIVENRSIRSLAATWQATPEQIPNGLWRRPVGRWSLAVNYAISGLQPWSYHALNLAVHLTAGVILFDLLRRTLLLKGISTSLGRDATTLACGAAVLWTVHPLQTESVTYIVQRLESMMGLFYLGYLYAVLRGSQSPRTTRWYAAAVAVCWLGMGTKEVMVTAPVVLLLYDRVFLADRWSQVFRRRGWLYAASLPPVLYLLWSAFGHRVSWLPDPVGPSFTNIFHVGTDRLSYLLSQPGVILHYLRLSFWPRGQCLDHMWPVADSLSSIALPATVILTIVAASLVGLRFRARLAFVGLAFFIILAPTSSISSLRLAFEHRMYLPLACVIVLFLIGLHMLMERWIASPAGRSRAWIVAISIAAVLLGCATHARNTVYYSRIAQYTDHVVKAPHNMHAYLNLGGEYLADGDHETAVALFRRAAELAPKDARPLTCLGNALIAAGKPQPAAALLTQAVRYKPEYSAAHYRLAVALDQLGQWDAARRRFEQAIHLNPLDDQLHNDFAVALLSRGRVVEAQQHLQQAVALNPDSSEAQNNLGIVIMMRQGPSAEAVAHFREALRLDPASEDARVNLRRAEEIID